MAGRLVIGQSGGPTPVMNATLVGIIREARRSGAFDAIYGLAHGLEGALSGTFHDLTHLDDAALAGLAQTPGAALGGTRCRLADDQYPRVLDFFRAHRVAAFAYIGGNGSMWVCARLAQLAEPAALRVIGVPKTVDNDLAGTDHAPGYGSAARFMALAARDCGRDLEAMTTFDDVVLLEAMGRDTGWLAAAAGLAQDDPDDAPHLIYVPELPFDEGRFLDDVARVHRRLGRVFVVVGEGLRDAGGRFIGLHAADGDSADTLGRVVYALATGPAAYLARLVRERLGLQSRFLRPGLIGRALSACVSAVDRAEAERVGAAAARLLADGQTGLMATLNRVSDAPYVCETGAVPLEQAAQGERFLPREYLDADGTMITPAFRRYAAPLVGDLPRLARLPALIPSAMGGR